MSEDGMTAVREQGLQVFRELLSGAVPDGDLRDGKFGDELLEIGIDNVFGRLWGREGLSRRERSLVTLGILIALRATDELSSSTSRSPATTGSPRTRSLRSSTTPAATPASPPPTPLAGSPARCWRLTRQRDGGTVGTEAEPPKPPKLSHLGESNS